MMKERGDGFVTRWSDYEEKGRLENCRLVVREVSWFRDTNQTAGVAKL